MVKALGIDDDQQICLLYESLFEQLGAEYVIANDVESAKRLFRQDTFDIVLLDLELPDGNGLDILPEFTGSPNAPEVIIVTGTGNTSGAELAFKYGAWDYIRKPFKLNEVSLPITRALEYRKEKLAQTTPKVFNRAGIVGESPSIKNCLNELSKAASTDAAVLITGETGTGKELFSKAIHLNSKRSEKPFIVIDCASLPGTLLESTLFGHEKGAFTGADRRQVGLLSQADGGTLMLDEIGDLPLSAQKSFLRVLQERTVRPLGGQKELSFDVRLVAATNVDIPKMVREGRFRQDLYYRVKAMEIILPPLRERGQDVIEIVHKKIFDLCAKYGIETKAVSTPFYDALVKYTWPGNVRELMNVLEYALASAQGDARLYPKHLSAELRVSDLGIMDDDEIKNSSVAPQSLRALEQLPSLTEHRQQHEKEYLEELVHRVEGDRKLASKISGVSQSRLYDLLGRHSINGFGSK